MHMPWFYGVFPIGKKVCRVNLSQLMSKNRVPARIFTTILGTYDNLTLYNKS
jgi:hypothetical protein